MSVSPSFVDENYVNCLCKTWTAVSGSRIMVMHACIPLPIELLKKSFLLYYTGKLCSKFGEDLCINSVTILYADAGWTPDMLTWFYILSNVLLAPVVWQCRRSLDNSVTDRTWNDLPDDVTSADSLSTFHQRLKTHLFAKSFFWLFPGLDFT